MKNRNLWKLAMGLGLIGVPIAGGCLQENSSQTPAPTAGAVTASAEPVVYQVPAPDAGQGEEAAALQSVPALTNLAEAKVTVIQTNQPVPPKVNLSPGAAELAKLAGSGVDQGVMLAYVTNAQSTFNLTADEIIYLNDLGVPGSVVTAMIQRDQVLKEQGKNALLAASAPVTSLPAPAPVPAEATPQPAPQPSDYPTEPAPAPPAEPVSYPVFYDSLAPYGTWVYVSGYGRCWRPTVVAVNPTWQPYFDGGHWVYTDCGWYWMSDYSWGWAPFHYGRWFRHSHWGWCWSPDTVWGPSWVSWRYSDVYCGWAPLPPGAYFSFSIGLTWHGHHVNHWDDCGLGSDHYRFVAWRHFDDHRVHSYGVHQREVNNIYRNSVVVNNITINNNTVINQGIPRERVASETRREIRPVAVHYTRDSGQPSAGRSERLRGNTLTVYRPVMPERERGTMAGTAGSPSRTGRGGAGMNAGGSAPSAPSARLADSASGTFPRTSVASESENRPGRPADRERTGSRDANVPTRAGQPTGRSDPSQPPTVVNAPAPAPQPPARTSPVPSRNETSGRGVAARPSTPVPSRQVAPAPLPAAPSGSGGTAVRPSAPTRSNNRSSLEPNRLNQSAPSATRTVTAPSAPTWRNADPDTRFDRYQAPTRSTPSAQPYRSPSYQQPARSAPEVPRNAPAPTYTAPSRQTAPSYSAPQRSLTPAPSYSRPDPAPSRSYSAPQSSPSRSYSPPQSSPSRSYSPPSSSPSQSAPSRSYSPPSPAPTRSAPSAPSSGSRGNSGRGQSS
ncbi:MAG TPA: DUF6600 domain-containing protein [Verrucomicrobiae bacterium]